MAPGLQEIKDGLMNLLNPSVLTFDSAEGVIVVLLCVVIVYKLTKHIGHFVGWCIGALFLVQLFYVLGFTVIDDVIPFSAVFKYDVITAVAQLFRGTFVCDILLYMSSLIHYVAMVLTEVFVKLFPPLSRILGAVFKEMPWEIFTDY